MEDISLHGFRTQHTPLNNVKVVIVGQDPYHNHNQAHGLAFSVRPPTIAPPSLVNIYKEIKNDYPSFQAPPNKGGLLIPWAERGVLMLNACLTVRAHQANSHSNKGWERFTQKVIDLVARVRTRGVVFLAWGAPAGKRVAGIDRKKHYVLQSVHPSPLSASRGFVSQPPSYVLLRILMAYSSTTVISESAMTGLQSVMGRMKSSIGIWLRPAQIPLLIHRAPLFQKRNQQFQSKNLQNQNPSRKVENLQSQQTKKMNLMKMLTPLKLWSQKNESKSRYQCSSANRNKTQK